MNSQEPIAPGLSEHRSFWLFFLGIVFVLAVSVSTLTTKPKISTDEAVSIELARNFQTDRVLDVKTAPAVFSGFGERLQSTGYPVTVPLSLFFKFFGYGMAQARIYMILWMLGAAAFLFWLGRRWFGGREALAAFFLLITFASFYGSGRTVVGEIPGFLFLLAGLYFLFCGERFFWAGFLMGLAVVGKPSVFGLIIPALVITYLIEWRKFFKVLVPIALGMLPAGILWIFLNLKEPFLSSTWANLFHFYQNPYGSSIASNVMRNLAAVPHSSTLVYFGILFLAVAAARFAASNNWKTLYDFVIVYGVTAFIYYLRSPGWLRYILIAELLILFLLPHALSLLSGVFKQKYPASFCAKRYWPILATLLVAVQAVQMFTVSNIFYSDGALRAAQSINENFPGKSVGVLNAVEVAVWLKTGGRYLAMDLTGLPQIGGNPLLAKEPPEVIVSHEGQRFLIEGRSVIESRYVIFDTAGGYTIYELRRG